MSRRYPELHDAPLAIASDGDILVGASHVFGVQSPVDLAERGCLDGFYKVFIGLRVPPRVRRELITGLDDPIVEFVSRLGLRTRAQGTR